MRYEGIECDTDGCDASARNPSDGWKVVSFNGMFYDFCSDEHEQEWREVLKALQIDAENPGVFSEQSKPDPQS